jgi:hypothetical protein
LQFSWRAGPQTIQNTELGLLLSPVVMFCVCPNFLTGKITAASFQDCPWYKCLGWCVSYLALFPSRLHNLKNQESQSQVSSGKFSSSAMARWGRRGQETLCLKYPGAYQTSSGLKNRQCPYISSPAKQQSKGHMAFSKAMVTRPVLSNHSWLSSDSSCL